MHNAKLYIPRNYCPSCLINADRFGAAILLVAREEGGLKLEKYVAQILPRTVFTVVLGWCDIVMHKPRKPEPDVD